MKNKVLFIGFATFLIILIVVFTEGLSRGSLGQWFNTKKAAMLYSSEQTGNVSIIRRGTGYVLMDDVGLIDGDTIVTSYNSTASLKNTDQLTAYLDEDTQVKIESCKGFVCIEALKGKIFLRTKEDKENVIYLLIKDSILSVGKDSVISIEYFSGTQTVNVYKGQAQVNFNGDTQTLDAGKQAVLLQNEDGAGSITYADIQPVRLSAFLIGKLADEQGVCFSAEELKGILDAREAETEAARRAQELHEAQVLARGGTALVISANVPGQNTSGKEGQLYECTVAVGCNTVLDNYKNLASGKSRYVPEDGVILAASKVEFIQGESVYDVLRRVCAYSNIAVAYSWTVEYGGYYIEGINNLFEFDCGTRSGWMYKVNGWYPNYGCSNYILKDGDMIVWNYTCDLGRDLGAEVR